jgi:flotillin
MITRGHRARDATGLKMASSSPGSCGSRPVAANAAQGPRMGSDLTGVDLAGLLSRLGGPAVSDTARTQVAASPGHTGSKSPPSLLQLA